MKNLRSMPLALVIVASLALPLRVLAQTSGSSGQQPAQSTQPVDDVMAKVNLSDVRRDSRFLTDAEKAKVRDQIAMLRAQGMDAEADMLQGLLDQNALRISTRATMKGAAMIATGDGLIFIQAEWLAARLAERGGTANVGSYYVHEIMHIAQYRTLTYIINTGGYTYWNTFQNEVQAYGKQIDYLTRLRDTSQNPALKAYYGALIGFLRAKQAEYAAKAQQPNAGKWLPGPPPAPESARLASEKNMHRLTTATLVLATLMPTASVSKDFLVTSPTPVQQNSVDLSQMNSFMPDGALSDSIQQDHANAVAFVWELADRNGGLVPAYDSSTWSVVQYQAALGRTLDPDEVASVQSLLRSPAAFRTHASLVGKALADQADGVSVIDVRGVSSSFTLSYGVDHNMAIVGSLLTADSGDSSGTAPSLGAR